MLLRSAMVMPAFEGCTARGQMYHVHGGSSPDYPIYPVVDFDEDGTVVGSLLLVDRAEMRAAHQMEVGAGYEPRWVEVMVPGWHESTLALAYHWPHSHRGPEVPSGDWLLEKAR